MELSLFDLHCDTAYEMCRQHLPFSDARLAVSLSGALRYAHYVQVMAHWTPPSLSDGEGWHHFLSVYENLFNDPAVLSHSVRIERACPDTKPDVPTLLLSLEDARILDRDASKVSVLADMGIRIVTPLWRGNSCIGGAHDTQNGLSAFGRTALAEMLSYGIVLDVSHASKRSFDDILSLCAEYSLPAIATHSNAYALCPVSRNLRDEQIRHLLLQNGIIGINLCTDFLAPDGNAGIEHVLSHIAYFASLGAKEALCLGCDFDGAKTPRELSGISSLHTIAEELLKRNYSETFVRGLFFENAFRFAKKHIQKTPKT